jgi:VMA21-like domain
MGVGTVAVFSVLLAAIPLSAFFATINGNLDATLAPLLGPTQNTDSNRLIFAGIIGVISVNLVVAAFLVAAWREPVPPSSTAQRPKED